MKLNFVFKNFSNRKMFRKFFTRNSLIFYRIKKDELERFLNDKNSIIIDVRSKEEFMKMKIKNAINIDVCNIEYLIHNIVKNKSSKIFLYCLNGSRTKIAISKLNKLGYYNLHVYGNGGINEINNEKLIEY